MAKKPPEQVEMLLERKEFTTEDIVNAYFPELKHDLILIEKAFRRIKPKLKTDYLKKQLTYKMIWKLATQRALQNFKKLLKHRNIELYNLNDSYFEKALYKTELTEADEYRMVQETVFKMSEITNRTLQKLKKKGPKFLMRELSKGQGTLFELAIRVSENEIRELKAV